MTGIPTEPVRERVLAAAAQLFADHGYDATSVAQVVAAAGVTKGALYHYFSSKEELLFEIYAAVIDEMLTSLDRILEAAQPPARTLRAIIVDAVGMTARHATAASVFTRESSRLDQQHWKTLQDRWRRYQDGVRGLIRDAQSRGEFATGASPEIITWMIFGVTNSMPTWYRPDGPKTPAEISQEITDLVFFGLMPHAAGKREAS
jgi:AcrR family transcriptional regulator